MGAAGGLCARVRRVSVSSWAQSNVGTIAAWIGMVLTMVVGTASQWTMLEAQHAQASERLDRVETASEQHAADIVKIKSDVRSITEAHDRLDVAVTRQEEATRQIDRLTVELRAVVNTLGARQ